MTKTIILKSERLIINRPGRTAPALCQECAGGMLTLDEAVAVADVSSRVIYRYVEAGAVHFAETPDSLLLVCLTSLTSHLGLSERPATRGQTHEVEVESGTADS